MVGFNLQPTIRQVAGVGEILTEVVDMRNTASVAVNAGDADFLYFCPSPLPTSPISLILRALPSLLLRLKARNRVCPPRRLSEMEVGIPSFPPPPYIPAIPT